jgi:SnoaL-like domain
MSQEQVELVHRGVDAFNRRDLDGYLRLADAEVEFRGLLAGVEGVYHGHEGVQQWWHDLLDAMPDFTLEVVEVRDLGGVTLTKLRAFGHGAGSDVPLEQVLWSPFRWREKKVVWGAVFPTEAEALEAVGLRE